MTYKPDFALGYIDHWKAGGHSNKPATHVVECDQNYTSYNVDLNYYDEFVEWVAQTFVPDNDYRSPDEPIWDLLERADISIVEW